MRKHGYLWGKGSRRSHYYEMLSLHQPQSKQLILWLQDSCPLAEQPGPQDLGWQPEVW